MSSGEIERELGVLAEEGFLDPSEKDSLRARAGNKGPLDLLYDDGVLSRDTLMDLRARLQNQDQVVTVKPQPKAELEPLSRPELEKLAAGWDRYDVQGFLGKGGMGLVYGAEDLSLKRRVALKFLTERDPEQIARFIREARAQARVEHENVCKVYEVGELGEHPYIAMQFLEGRTLTAAAHELGLEEKILVMRQIAEGLQAAHSVGLIHRDIKPGNIIYQRLEDGALKATILDFGLAHFGDERHVTITGSILGTPAYMSPEQARGDLDSLDRRTDVYSLGATLYQVLTGKPPFDGGSTASILLNIVAKEPKPPRQHKPDIPADIDTITLKCLEKAPGERYDSAQAVAAELTRWLDGDPILARPAGPGRRLMKRIRKNKTAVMVGLVSLLLAGMALGWTTWRSTQRERIVRDLSEQVEEIESLARLSLMSPAHDIRPDRARLRERIARMSERIESSGSLVRGVGNYAMGAGFMALNELEQAKEHLQDAWDGGYRSDRIAYQLGLVHTMIYRREVRLLREVMTADGAEERLEALRRKHRDEARNYISQVEELETVSPVYIKALLAFSEGDYQRALNHLQNAQERRPWFYEAVELEADIYAEQAGELLRGGQNDAARAKFDAALEAYGRALDITESNPDLYLSMSSVTLNMIYSRVFSNEDLNQDVAQCLNYLNQLRKLLPGDFRGDVREAILWQLAADQNMADAADQSDNLEMAEAALNRAFAKNPEHPLVLLNRGRLYWRKARQLMTQRQNPEPELRIVTESLSKIPEEHRDYSFYNTLGYAAMTLARNEQDEAACPLYDQSFEALRQAAGLKPDRIEPLNTLAVTIYRRVVGKTCPDDNARALLEEAVAVLQAAIKLNPNQGVLHYQLGRTYNLLAQSGDFQSGIIDRDIAQKGVDAHKQAGVVSPRLTGHANNAAAQIYLALVQEAWGTGRDWRAVQAEGVTFSTAAVEALPSDRAANTNKAWLHFYRGKYSVRSGKPVGDSFQKARNHVADLPEADAARLLVEASIKRMEAEADVIAGRNPTPNIAASQALLKQLKAIQPTMREAHRSLARLATLEARHLRQSEQNADEAVKRAAAHLEQAGASNNDDPYFLMALGRLALIRTDLPQSEQRRILKRLESAPEASFMTNELKLMRAALQASLGNTNEAEKLRNQVFNTNPNLKPEWATTQ